MHPTEIHLLSKTSEDSHIKRIVDAPQVLPNHLFRQAFACDQEAGHCARGVFQEAALNQVNDALIGFLVEDVQARPVVSFAYDFVDGVHVGHPIVGHHR